MANTNRSHYAAVFQGWASKLHGPQPTEAQLATAHGFGRPGKQSMAIAMMLRDGGASGHQIKQVSALFDGNPTPHLNKARELIAGGSFNREPGTGYKLTLTPKGQAWLDKHAAGAGATVVAATPAKAASKPRKAKGKPAKVTPEANATAKAVTEPEATMPEANPVGSEAQTGISL